MAAKSSALRPVALSGWIEERRDMVVSLGSRKSRCVCGWEEVYERIVRLLMPYFSKFMLN